MTDRHESTPIESRDPEVRELLGLFDAPAFARRGQELEQTLARLHARCRREREALLEMVRLRLRQWAAAVEGPDAWQGTFAEPLAALWTGAGSEPAGWAARPLPPRHRRAIARDLVASVARFNRRWDAFLAQLALAPINELIDRYNRYYVFEKECLVRSVHLAARHFQPRAHVTPESLRAEYPPLPVPGLRERRGDPSP